MTSCPYCESEMTCKWEETLDLDYYDTTKRTDWTFTEMWSCYECPGPEDEEE